MFLSLLVPLHVYAGLDSSIALLSSLHCCCRCIHLYSIGFFSRSHPFWSAIASSCFDLPYSPYHCRILEITCMYKIPHRINICYNIKSHVHVKHKIFWASWKEYVVVTSYKSLDLGKGFLDGIQIGRVRWKILNTDTWKYSIQNLLHWTEEQNPPKRSASSRISSPWWIRALSITSTLNGPG